MSSGEVVEGAPIGASYQEQWPHMMASARFGLVDRGVMIEVTTRRHEAQAISGPVALAFVGLRPMYEERIEDDHLARFQLDIDSPTLLVFFRPERTRKHEAWIGRFEMASRLTRCV